MTIAQQVGIFPVAKARGYSPPLLLWARTLPLVWLMVAPAAVPAQPAAEPLSGPAFLRALNDTSTVAWEGISLGHALRNLGREYRLAVVLDRRVDPNREIALEGTLSVRDLFLNLARIYSEQHARPDAAPRPAPALGVTFYGSVVFVGPQNVAFYLRTLAEVRKEEVRELPSAVRNRLIRTATSRWDDATEPRQLIETLAKEAGLAVEGISLVPHDLRPAAVLPAMPWCDRLTLLLAQFDLTYSVSADGSQLTIRPVTEEDLRLERLYPGGSNTLADFRARLPEAQVEARGGQVVVRGRLEDHEAAQGKVATTGTTSNADEPVGVDLYTMNIRDTPLRSVLNYLERNLKLKFAINEAALKDKGISLDERISFRVERAPLDELLKAALAPAGLVPRRTDQTVEILPEK